MAGYSSVGISDVLMIYDCITALEPYALHIMRHQGRASAWLMGSLATYL